MGVDNKKLWIDTRLSEEEMNFLNGVILNSKKISYNSSLAGNIFKSELIEDKDNWFYETVLKKLTERIFYRDWNNYYKYHIEKEDPLPKFKMNKFWVNYQKQYEFNPIHGHSGLYSFVVFIKIPTHWKEQHALPFSAHSNHSLASDFEFVWSEYNSMSLTLIPIPLSPEDEGRMLFFPATLHHMVHPFYGTEEERITISGNIDYISVSGTAESEKMKEAMAHSVKTTKKELKLLKEVENNT